MKKQKKQKQQKPKFSWESGKLFVAQNTNINNKIMKSGNEQKAYKIADKFFEPVTVAFLTDKGLTTGMIKNHLEDCASGKGLLKGYFFATSADVMSFIECAQFA